MGGPVPLGYKVLDRKLVVNADEAVKVRKIFQIFVELGSVAKLAARLRDLGITSRRTTLSNGRIRGGVFMARGALKPMLQNRIYLGDMHNNGKFYSGLHEPIVSKELWEKANTLLLENSKNYQAQRYSRNPAPLRNKLFDSKGYVMVPKTSYRNGASRYRIYMSHPILKGQKNLSGEVRSIPADMIEPLVLARISLRPIHELDDETCAKYFEKIERVELYRERVTIQCRKRSSSEPSNLIEIPIRLDRAGVEIIATSTDPKFQPELPRIDKPLVRALVKAYAMRRKLESGEARSVADLVTQFGVEKSHIRRLLPLGFLAPDLMELILDGRQSPRLTLGRLLDGNLPLDWEKQRALISSV